MGFVAAEVVAVGCDIVPVFEVFGDADEVLAGLVVLGVVIRVDV